MDMIHVEFLMFHVKGGFWQNKPGILTLERKRVIFHKFCPII